MTRYLLAVGAALVAVGVIGCSSPPFTQGDPIDPDLPERAALIVIDFQRDFLRDDGALPVDAAQGERALAQTNRLLQAVDSSATPVVYVVNAFDPLDPANPFRGNAAIAGSEGAAIDERLVMLDAPVFDKAASDAFSNPAFDEHLRAEEVTHLYLTGMFADGCVWATGLGGAARGYHVTMIEDAVATETDDRLQASLEVYEADGFELLTAEEAGRTLELW